MVELNIHQPPNSVGNNTFTPEEDVVQYFPVQSILSSPVYSLSQSPYTASTPFHPSLSLPCCSYSPAAIQPLDISVERCTVCEAECTSAHKYPGCNNPIHTICGHAVDGMEGNSCPVWCVSCWIYYRDTDIQQGRLKAKRGR